MSYVGICKHRSVGCTVQHHRPELANMRCNGRPMTTAEMNAEALLGVPLRVFQSDAIIPEVVRDEPGTELVRQPAGAIVGVWPRVRK